MCAEEAPIGSRIEFVLDTLKQRLWVKPLGFALLAILVTLAARAVDGLGSGGVPDISQDTVFVLLSVISTSMLGVATFAVASMVSAYASAGSTATPRVFALLVKDGSSQSALSSFIGAFIFSIVGIVALKTGYYGVNGRLMLFVLTLVVIAWVIYTFVRWVDRIARLGRMGNTIEKLQQATEDALTSWGPGRSLGARPVDTCEESGTPIFAARVGYVQHVDLEALQSRAEQHDLRLHVATPPGALATPSRPLLYVDGVPPEGIDEASLAGAFVVADVRTFVQDPRLGLIAMSEIASRALSPAVNDPGTAIQVLASLVQTICAWCHDTLEAEPPPPLDRIQMRRLDLGDLFDDAFDAIARDGAGIVEVGIRLQKCLHTIDQLGHGALSEVARKTSRHALARAGQHLGFARDLERVRAAAAWSAEP